MALKHADPGEVVDLRPLGPALKDAKTSALVKSDRFEAVRQSNPDARIVQAIVLFDEYRGKGLEADEKSLAFRFSLQDTQNTLQETIVEAAMAAMVNAASLSGAKPRS